MVWCERFGRLLAVVAVAEGGVCGFPANRASVEGAPAPERLADYPREQWRGFYRQLGAIARTAHSTRGPHFGPVAGPAHPTWGEALLAAFSDIADDLDRVGLDSASMRAVAACAARARTVLDEIAEPWLMTGDLWTVNTLLDVDAPEPVIVGVLDFDRVWFGDPAADWPIHVATVKQEERSAFGETCGPLEQSPAARLRSAFSKARHLGAIQLERYRLGNHEDARDSGRAITSVLAEIESRLDPRFR